MWADYSATTGCAITCRLCKVRSGPPGDAETRPARRPLRRAYPSAATRLGRCVPGRPAGRLGTQGSASIKAQNPEPRPHSQKTALPDSRSHLLNVIELGFRLAAFSSFEVSLKLKGYLELQLLKRHLVIAPMIEDGGAGCISLRDCARCD